ncbi:MAG TPA: hypothetical protein PKE47_15325, partial [Verrucomicrobiota bacterium]|nr:hypothetical protein [Verrucomicrobiota bacterium]
GAATPSHEPANPPQGTELLAQIAGGHAAKEGLTLQYRNSYVGNDNFGWASQQESRRAICRLFCSLAPAGRLSNHER